LKPLLLYPSRKSANDFKVAGRIGLRQFDVMEKKMSFATSGFKLSPSLYID
jgi:hypothetical protein